MSIRVTVLTPDLALDGGVTNYYKTIRLDTEENIDYFFVNKPHTKSQLSKVACACVIFVKFFVVAWRSQLIHVNPSLNFNSFYRDMVFIALARLLRKKILVFFRGWDEDFQHTIERSWLMSTLFRATYAKADRYLVLSKDFKSRLISLGVSSGKPIQVETTVADSGGLDGFDIEMKVQSATTHVKCLFISRILRDKGIFIAIDAFVECQLKVDRKMTLYVAGEGPDLDAAKTYVQNKGWSGIQFLGEVRGREKLNLLIKCHILVLPTYHAEGLPNCVLEGMLYGMPIVSRTNAGIPDVVENGVNGYLTESTKSDVFAGFLIDLVEDNSRYGEIAKANFEKARSAFTIKQVRDRLLDVYGLME